MLADCGSCCAKYVLCLFNFIFFLAGTIVLGIGVWVAIDKASLIALLKMVDSEDVKEFTQPAVIDQMAYALIVCGAIMFFLSFFGYFGAMRESRCLLTTYAVIMIMLLICEITAVVLLIVFKDKANIETKQFLNQSISKYYSHHNNDAVTLMWNRMMAQLSCCGVESYTDFESASKWMEQRGNKVIPDACCQLSDVKNYTLVDSNCPISPSESNSYFNTGCYETLLKWIHTNQIVILCCLIGVIVFQLFATFLSFCICKSIQKYRGMRL